MKLWVRIIIIITAILLLAGAGMWLMACLFAAGQLNNSYDLWLFFRDAPGAALILAALLISSVFLLVFAIKKK